MNFLLRHNGAGSFWLTTISKARHDNHFSLETLRAALTKEAVSALYGQTSVKIAWIATPQGRRFCLFFPNRREGPLSNRQIRAQEDEGVEAIQHEADALLSHSFLARTRYLKPAASEMTTQIIVERELALAVYLDRFGCISAR
jgi:hypothetical protein